ncbi:MAG: helix-turn-helix transcriptional regulator [Fimbriimonadaceae bacterium]|nr:helix-turn-helix transcriptional regulator [Chitinophagales bacterium]
MHKIAKGSDIYIFENLSQNKLERASEILRTITHPLRMKMMAYIDKNKEVHVTKIFSALNLEQSVVSQHLKVLRNSGYVIAKRQGKLIYYSLNYKLISDTLMLIEKYKIK